MIRTFLLRWRLAFLVGAALVSVLLLWGGARAIQGLHRVEQAGSTVRSMELSFEAFGSDASPDMAALQGRVAQVEALLRKARSELTPFLQLSPLLGWMPRVGPELRSSQDMLGLGDSLTRASRDLLTAVEVATAGSSQGAVQLLQGNQFNESALLAMSGGEPFFRSAASHLGQARATLERLEGRELPSQFQGMVASARQILPDLETFARIGLAASQLWEPFLGYDRPRTYLLVAQNSDELRATGGFIPGAWLLTLDRGEIAQLQFWDTVAVDDLSASLPLPPEGLLQSLWAGVWLFRDAAWYPDFPTSATVIEQVFNLGQGITFDGVIALNQWAVQGILEAIGPVALPTGETLEASTYLDVLEVNTDAFGRAYMDTVLQSLLDGLREQGSREDLTALLAAVNRSLVQKDILLNFHNPALQGATTGNGWDGALREGPGDFLMVVDSNVGISKVNRNITQRIDYVADLGNVEKPSARLDILYTNQSSGVPPTACTLQAANVSGPTYLKAKNTCYWDYLRVYAPEGSVLDSSSPFPMPQGALYRRIGYNDIEDTLRTYSESSKRVFAGFFNLEVGESRRVAFLYALPPQVVQEEEGHLTYRLFLQKQPGTRNIPVVVTVLLPEGYGVRSALPDPSSVSTQEVQFTIVLDSDSEIELMLEPR